MLETWKRFFDLRRPQNSDLRAPYSYDSRSFNNAVGFTGMRGWARGNSISLYFHVSSVVHSELFYGSVNSIFFDSFYGTLQTLLLNISEAYLHQSIMNIKSAHMAGKCFWINEIMKWNMNNLLHQICVLYNCPTGIAHSLCKKKKEIKSYYNRHFEFCHQPLGWQFLEAKTVTLSSLNINFQRCNALMREKKIEKVLHSKVQIDIYL